jgi:hypothetical protein
MNGSYFLIISKKRPSMKMRISFGSTPKSVLDKCIELIDDRYADGLSFRSLLPPNFFESTAFCGKNSGAKRMLSK